MEQLGWAGSPFASACVWWMDVCVYCFFVCVRSNGNRRGGDYFCVQDCKSASHTITIIADVIL